MCQKHLLFGLGNVIIGSGTTTAKMDDVKEIKIPTLSFHTVTVGTLKPGDAVPEDIGKNIKDNNVPADVLLSFLNREGVDAVIDSLIMFKNEQFPLDEKEEV